MFGSRGSAHHRDRKDREGDEGVRPVQEQLRTAAGPIPPLGTPYELLIGDITETVTNDDKGKYKYKIKIKKNGQESLDAQAAAEDEFRLCPVWPCE